MTFFVLQPLDGNGQAAPSLEQVTFDSYLSRDTIMICGICHGHWGRMPMRTARHHQYACQAIAVN